MLAELAMLAVASVMLAKLAVLTVVAVMLTLPSVRALGTGLLALPGVWALGTGILARLAALPGARSESRVSKWNRLSEWTRVVNPGLAAAKCPMNGSHDHFLDRLLLGGREHTGELLVGGLQRGAILAAQLGKLDLLLGGQIELLHERSGAKRAGPFPFAGRLHVAFRRIGFLDAVLFHVGLRRVGLFDVGLLDVGLFRVRFGRFHLLYVSFLRVGLGWVRCPRAACDEQRRDQRSNNSCGLHHVVSLLPLNVGGTKSRGITATSLDCIKGPMRCTCIYWAGCDPPAYRLFRPRRLAVHNAAASAGKGAYTGYSCSRKSG